MIKLGIECENQEDKGSQWGIGRIVHNLVKEYTLNPEWQDRFSLYLYFKNSVPADEIFKHPSLNIRVVGPKWNRFSFNIFYNLFMPIRAMIDRLDYMFFPAYMLPPLYFGKAITLLTNDVYYEYKRGVLPLRYRIAYRIFSNWAAIRSWRVLAISDFSKKEVSRLFSVKPNKIFVSRLGVNSSDEYESDYSLVPDGKYFIYTAQMFPRRRAKEVIEAFHKLAHERKDISLVLVGKDKYRPNIIGDMVKGINLSFGEDRIIWHEYIENNSKFKGLIEKAEAMIYISSAEAFGLPLAEASYLGIPVIAKDNDLNRELFGQGPYYVENERDPDSILKTMNELLEDTNRSQKIDIARNKASQYTWKNFTDTFFEYLSK